MRTDTHDNPADGAADMRRPMGALLGLASLLACVDPQLWDSVGRPAARDLATLVFTVHGELEAGVEALMAEAATTA